MKSIKEFIPLWKLIKDQKKKIIIGSILIFIAELSSVLTGYLNGMAVEAVTDYCFKNAIVFLLIYFGVEIIFDNLFSVIGSAIFQKIESTLTRRLQMKAYKKALELPAYAYESISSGEIINRISVDTGVLSFSFQSLLEIVSSIIGSIIVIIYVFCNSWIIGLEILIFLVILFFVLKYYNPKLKTVNKQRKKGSDSFTSLVTETVRGIREIKTLGVKNNIIKDADSSIHSLLSFSFEEIRIWKNSTLITYILKTFIEVGVFMTCVILMISNSISLAFFVAMTYYVYRFMHLVENINSFSQTYQKINVSLNRVNEIIENRLFDDIQYGNLSLNNPKGVIEFKNVSFGYPGEKKLLNKLNLKLEPNKKIAIIGKSEQGKSTIFNLLTRIFDTKEGTILIDGTNIKDLTEESLRKNISIIRQEPYIFNRTIKENFKLIDKNISLNDIKRYSHDAYIDEYINSLPKKYNTLIGEGGVNLSGGQKQRLAIARTLAKDSKIILFDEATSALDNKSQEYIKKSIDNLVKDHTVVIVAHRLSTIIDADVIYLIDHGKVIASGTHEELLTNDDYRNLYYTESLNS